MAQETELAGSHWTAGRIAQATLFIVSVIVSFYLLYRFRTVALFLFVAMLVGAGIKPPVGWLTRRGISRLYAQILIFALLLMLFIVFVLLMVPPLLEQGTAITTTVATYYNDLQSAMIHSDNIIIRNMGYRMPPGIDLGVLVENAQQQSQNQQPSNGAQPQQPPPAQGQPEEAATQVAQALDKLTTIARVFFAILAVFLLSFYWTLEGDRIMRAISLLAAPARRDEIREMVAAVEGKLGGYLIGQSLLMLSIGLLSLAAFLLIRLPNALFLAILAGFTEAIPVVGPLLGATPAVIVAATQSPDKVIWVILAASLIQFSENHLLVPRIMDREVGVNPLLTLLSFAALTAVLGIVGALLAVPLAAVFQLAMNRFVVEPIREAPIKPEGRDYVSYLRLQAQEISQDIRKQDEGALAEESKDGEPDTERLEEKIEAIANDLDRVLSQVNQAERAQI